MGRGKKTAVLKRAAQAADRVELRDMTSCVLKYKLGDSNLPSGGYTGSDLSVAASTMTAGEWKRFDNYAAGMVNFGNGAAIRSITGTNDHSMYAYTNRSEWDPISRRVLHIGQGHNCTPRFVRWDDETNTWQSDFTLSGITANHGYNHATLNPYTGDLYWREYNDFNVAKFSHAAETWSYIPDWGTSVKQVAGALEYFPDRNSLVFMDGDWGVWEYDLSTNPVSWTCIAQTNGGDAPPVKLTGLGSYQNVSCYCPTAHAVAMGGGCSSNSQTFYLYYDDGTWSDAITCPAGFNDTYGLESQQAIMVVDPVGGNILIWDSAGNCFEFNPATLTWANGGDSVGSMDAGLYPAGSGGVTSMGAVPIPLYGVIMFLYAMDGVGKVYLYRHTVPTDDSDFARRYGAAGVIRYVGFNDAADIEGDWDDKDNTGLVRPVGPPEPILDTSIKASGASSLRWTIPSLSGSTTCDYFCNFSADLLTQFGEGDTFYVQWRQRFSSDFLTTVFTGANGWKQIIIGAGDVAGDPIQQWSSNTHQEVVAQNSYHRGYAQMYVQDSMRQFVPLEESYGDYDFKLQNAMPAPYCLYSDGTTGCYIYYPNEWMTFQIRVSVGTWSTASSTVEMWAAREHAPSTKIHSWSNLTLYRETGTEYGKVWFTPYNTNKSAAQEHPVCYTWYDELIISTNRIPDPIAC